MGVFSSHQPVYAEHGIATFPLNDNKRPAIQNYQKVGLPASAMFAARFPASDGFGFMTNARSGITVLDVDTTDDRMLADAMCRHGSTPLVGRTASGKFHALYRHNGEFRKIRPFGDLPIDLLGIGGLVVAVPSRFREGGILLHSWLPRRRPPAPRHARARRWHVPTARHDYRSRRAPQR